MAHAGMLRASCESNQIDIDMRVVIDPERSCDVKHYRELIAFTDAVLEADEQRLRAMRESLRGLVGDTGVRRAAAVVGNFQMMNRALDTLGATFGDKLPSRVKELMDLWDMQPPDHWPA